MLFCEVGGGGGGGGVILTIGDQFFGFGGQSLGGRFLVAGGAFFWDRGGPLSAWVGREREKGVNEGW